MILRKVKEEKNFGIKKGGLFFSNSVEVLLEHLKITLFAEGSSPFSEHLLIVPSQQMEQFIELQLASSLSIASGFKTVFLTSGIDILCEKLFPSQQKARLPSRLDLHLKIFEQIEKALEEGNALFEPLKNYVGASETRKLCLTKKLVSLFSKYGVYGAEESAQWCFAPANWQEALFARVFSTWQTPQTAYMRLENAFADPTAFQAIHLFALSHLSALHFHFFCMVSRHVPVYLYHVSPCQEHWSTPSPEHPHLLTTFGKVGRQMAHLFEESGSVVEESYLVFGGTTALRSLQREILTLQPEERPVADHSIVVNSLITPHHEVEHLHQWLQQQFAERKLEPKDVLVAAPDIYRYVHFIEPLFSASAIAYRVDDLPLIDRDPALRGLFLLLDLESRRWSAPAVLELLEHPLFCKKQGFGEEDLVQIRKWAIKCGICWGVDGAHRERLLKKSHCSQSVNEGSATWLGSLGHLIEELALPSSPSLIEFSQAQLLGDLYSLIDRLYRDLAEVDTKQGLREWAMWLEQLSINYLAETPKIVCAVVKQLMNAEEQCGETLYPFALVRQLLEEAVEREHCSLNRNLCQAVHFCSMQSMRLVPAKVICLLGLSHDHFPRRELHGSLDLLRQKGKGDYAPTLADSDRTMFLEALLSARETLFISFVGQDPYDHSALPPSSVVADLLGELPGWPVTYNPGYETAHLKIEALPCLHFPRDEEVELPRGAVVIDVHELVRLVRSPLGHYLLSRNLKIAEEESPCAEEPFILSPLHKKILGHAALDGGIDRAFELAQKRGLVPLGLLGQVVREQLQEVCTPLASLQLEGVELPPLQLVLNQGLNVTLVGTIEHVADNGLVSADSCSVKNALKIWPLYLLLSACHPHKTTLHFPLSGEKKEIFFDDPIPLLKELVRFFFHAQQKPFFFSHEIIEPLLKNDPVLLKKTPIYDKPLLLQLLSHKSVDYEKWALAYSPLVDRLFGQMIANWFY